MYTKKCLSAARQASGFPCFLLSVCCRSRAGSQKQCQTCWVPLVQKTSKSWKHLWTRPDCFETATRWKTVPSSPQIRPNPEKKEKYPAKNRGNQRFCFTKLLRMCLCWARVSDLFVFCFGFSDSHLQYGAQVFIGIIPAHLQFSLPEIKGNILPCPDLHPFSFHKCGNEDVSIGLEWTH